MFGIGPFEFIIIVVGALVFIGPDRLPAAMKEFGKWFIKAKRASAEVKNSIDSAIHNAERELQLEELKKQQTNMHQHVSSLIEAELEGDEDSKENMDDSPEFSVANTSHHKELEEETEDPFKPYLDDPNN